MTPGQLVVPNGLDETVTVVSTDYRAINGRPGAFRHVVTVRWDDGTIEDFSDSQLSAVCVDTYAGAGFVGLI